MGEDVRGESLSVAERDSTVGKTNARYGVICIIADENR